MRLLQVSITLSAPERNWQTTVQSSFKYTKDQIVNIDGKSETKKNDPYSFYRSNFMICVYIPRCVHAQLLSHVQLFATPWTIECQAALSMGLFRQEQWSGLSFTPPGDLTDPGIESSFPVSSALAGRFFTAEPPRKPTYPDI